MSPLGQTCQILADVARFHGLSVAVLTGRNRTAGVCLARDHAYAAVSTARGLSDSAIGRLFGRDHTSVADGIRRHRARIAWAAILCEFGEGAMQPDLFAVAA